MTLPGETEAGSAGMQPCRGITWWAHRDDDRSAEPSRPRSSNNHIGSVDPDALKIPAPKGRNTNQQWDAPPPFHAEPEHESDIVVDVHWVLLFQVSEPVVNTRSRHCSLQENPSSFRSLYIQTCGVSFLLPASGPRTPFKGKLTPF